MNVKRSPYKELDMENLIQDKYVKNGATGDDRFFEEKLKKALFESRDCTQMEFLNEVKIWLNFYMYDDVFDYYVEKLMVFQAHSDFDLGLFTY